MLQFTARRLLLLVPVLVGILLVTFIILRAIPSDPCMAMFGEKATPEVCAQFRVRFGLNDNIFVQFIRYMIQIVQGNFGQLNPIPPACTGLCFRTYADDL